MIDLKLEKKEFKNGLTWFHCEVPFLHSVFLGFYVRAGSATEYQEKNWGMSHFLEHVVFNGTKKYPDGDKLRDLIAEKGIIENAWTFASMTNYYKISPLKSVDVAFDGLLEIVFNPALTDKSIEKERGIIAEERRKSESDPGRMLGEKLSEQTFFETTYAHPILGYMKDIEDLDPDELRKYHKTFYSPNNCRFVTYGGASFEELQDKFSDQLSELEPQDLPEHDFKSPGEGYDKKNVNLKMDTPSAFYGYQMRLPKVKSIDEYVASAILVSHLAMGEASVFKQEFSVKDALVSSISSNLITFQDLSFFYVVAAMSENKKEIVRGKVMDVLKSTVSDGLSEEEFERAKGYIYGHLLRNIESVWLPSSTTIANVMRTNFLLDLDGDLSGIVEAVNSAKLDDVVDLWGEMVDFGKGRDGYVTGS